MDIHEQDPFSEVSILERILNRPFNPKYLTNALRPGIRRSFTSEFGVVVGAEGSIRVLDYSERGTPLPQNRLGKRKMNKIAIPRVGEGFTVSAEEKRDVSTVALDGRIEAAQTIVDRHLDSVNDNLEATEENQLTHAVRGYITNKAGEVIVDLFDELGQEQQVHAIDVTDSKPWIRQLQGAMNKVDDGLTGDVTPGYLLVGGSDVGEWMESDATFLQAQTNDAAVRLSLEDSRGFKRINSSVSFLPTRKGYFDADEAYLIPTTAGFFTKMLGPSDSLTYEGQVLEAYVTSKVLDHGMGWEYAVTKFLLQYPKKPGAIVRIDFQGIGG